MIELLVVLALSPAPQLPNQNAASMNVSYSTLVAASHGVAPWNRFAIVARSRDQIIETFQVFFKAVYGNASSEIISLSGDRLAAIRSSKPGANGPEALG